MFCPHSHILVTLWFLTGVGRGEGWDMGSWVALSKCLCLTPCCKPDSKKCSGEKAPGPNKFLMVLVPPCPFEDHGTVEPGSRRNAVGKE